MPAAIKVVSTLGITASTGTVISTLSGAAATSATSAAVGGSTISAALGGYRYHCRSGCDWRCAYQRCRRSYCMGNQSSYFRWRVEGIVLFQYENFEIVFGGPYRDRTGDLFAASEALSQLS